MTMEWNDGDWRSVWEPDGARWVGYAYGGAFVQTVDNRIELRFPVCPACEEYFKSKEVVE